MDENIIISSVISLVIAFIGAIVSVWSSKHQVNSQIESLRQTQFTEIVKKRIEVYPKLWNIVLRYTTNWDIEGRPHDTSWVSSFLSAINECHAEIGVYFSQSVYEKFCNLRKALSDLEKKSRSGGKITEQDIRNISDIFSGKDGTPGLATQLKNDLGSYRDTLIQQ